LPFLVVRACRLREQDQFLRATTRTSGWWLLLFPPEPKQGKVHDAMDVLGCHGKRAANGDPSFSDCRSSAVSVLSFSAYRREDELVMTLIVEADPAKAKRVEGLLRRLQAALRVDAFREEDGLVRTLALAKVRCDMGTRDPLLQMLGATRWRVVQFHPLWISIEVVRTDREVAEFCAFVQSYGPVEIMSIAAAPMRTRSTSKSHDSPSAQERALDAAAPPSEQIRRDCLSDGLGKR
jgi:acetolactate synthase small subunit